MEYLEQELKDLQERENKLSESLEVLVVESTTASPLSPMSSTQEILPSTASTTSTVGETSFMSVSSTGLESVIESPYACKKLLLIIRGCRKVPCDLIAWMKRHGPAVYTDKTALIVAVPVENRASGESPLLCTREQLSNNPNMRTELLRKHSDLQVTFGFVDQLPNEQLSIYAFGPYEMTRGCVGLAQETKADVVIVADCKPVSKKEFEAPDYTPLLEEIILKEAIQPVILFKAH